MRAFYGIVKDLLTPLSLTLEPLDWLLKLSQEKLQNLVRTPLFWGNTIVYNRNIENVAGRQIMEICPIYPWQI